MASCHNCGLSISETATFCATCGAAVPVSPAPQADAPLLPVDDDWVPPDDDDRVPYEYQVAPQIPEPTSALRSVATSVNGTSIAIAAIAVTLAVMLHGASLSSLPDDLFLTALGFAILFVTMRTFGIGVTFIQLFVIAAMCQVIGLALGFVVAPMIAHILGPDPGLAALPFGLFGLIVSLLIQAEVITWVTEAEYLTALAVVIVAWLAGASVMYMLLMSRIYG